MNLIEESVRDREQKREKSYKNSFNIYYITCDGNNRNISLFGICSKHNTKSCIRWTSK